MKKIIQWKLNLLARMVIARHKPVVIGITGSVGKTSTKEAVVSVLGAKFRVRGNIKNYNNEIGLPLTIIGMESPGRSLCGWLFVLWRGFLLASFKSGGYPEVLVLEMGVDHPGDMLYLTGIAKPDIAVVTTVGNVHLENFGSKSKLWSEKADLVRSLSKDGWSVLNYDDEAVRKMTELSKAKVMTFGFNEKASVAAVEVNFGLRDRLDAGNALKNTVSGINFKIKNNGAAVPVLLPGVVGYNALYGSLAATTVGLILGMNLHEISEALRNFKSPRGRMNLIPGRNNALIIDDTYNAEPKSVAAGLAVLADFGIAQGAKKYAVLGDMLELGDSSDEEHKKIGRMVAELGVDFLVTIGEGGEKIGLGALSREMDKDRIFHFADSVKAGNFIKDRLTVGDLIFVKGSQGVRMEKTVKILMLEPEKAVDLLVRQVKEWLGN